MELDHIYVIFSRVFGKDGVHKGSQTYLTIESAIEAARKQHDEMLTHNGGGVYTGIMDEGKLGGGISVDWFKYQGREYDEMDEATEVFENLLENDEGK
jgi:hypothetical protein